MRLERHPASWMAFFCRCELRKNAICGFAVEAQRLKPGPFSLSYGMPEGIP